MCREASRLREGGAQGHGFAGADFAGDDAEGVLADAPADPGGGLGVGAVAVQHARGQVAAERHLGESVVGLEFLDAHCVLLGDGFVDGELAGQFPGAGRAGRGRRS